MTSKRGGIAGRKRKSQIGGQFVAYRIEMLESSAWRALSLQGRKVLNRLEIEHAAHGGAENGTLPCRYKDFEAYGCRRKGISAALIEVEALGFLQTTALGTRSFADIPGKATTFRLTYLHTADGPPSDEWKRFKSLEEAHAAVELEKKRHDAWLDAAQGSPRRRQPKNTKTKRQGAECPNTGGELPPKNSESLGNVPPTGQGAECHHLSTSRVRDAA